MAEAGRQGTTADAKAWAVADALADAMRGLMAAEGGEPGPEPGQRAAWARADRALAAHHAARPLGGTCTTWPLFPCLPLAGMPDRHTHPGTTHGKPYICPGSIRAAPYSPRHARRLMAQARAFNAGVREMGAVDARANRAWALGPSVATAAGVLEEPWPLGDRKPCTCPAWAVVHPSNRHVATCPHASGDGRDLEG